MTDHSHQANVRDRLEYLRTEISEERISLSEIVELQSLGAQGAIDPGDVELLQWAGVPEFEGDEE